MKKALVVLLILAVAGGAFAQLTFSGHIRSGIGLMITDKENADPAFINYMVGDGLQSRLDLQASFTHEDGNAGGRILLRSAFGAVNVQNIEAWFKAMDGMVTIYGGNIDNGGYATGGGVDTNLGNHGGTGMFINVAPMAGLGIRAGVYPGGNAFFGGTAPTMSFSSAGKLLEEARYSFGVTYTAPDLVTVVALLRQSNGKIYDMTDAAIGVKVLALASMGLTTLNVDAAIYNLQKSEEWAKIMHVQIGQQLAYVSGDLTIGGRFMQQLLIFDDDTPDEYTPDLSFAVWLQYVMGNIVPRLDAGFNMGRGFDGGATDPRGNWDGVAKGSVSSDGLFGFEKDMMNLAISPSVAFRFGSASHYIKLGYVMQMDMSNDTDAAIRETMRNTIFVDYRVNF